MKNFKDFTLQEYVDVLAKKEPVPGGGSAAALTACCAAGLLAMVANYSVGKTANRKIERRLAALIKRCYQYRDRFLELVDLDAKAYLEVVKTKKLGAKEHSKAQRNASKIPQELAKLC